jgi:hypothetical protein
MQSGIGNRLTSRQEAEIERWAAAREEAEALDLWQRIIARYDAPLKRKASRKAQS